MTTPLPPDDLPPWSLLTPARWLRWGVAFVWLWTGLAVFHPYYRELGASYLEPLGLPPAVMYGTCAAEVLLGLRVALGRAATWVTALQVVLIAGFTAILSVSWPGLWLHPLGVLTKNLALLAMVGTAWLLERRDGSRRAYQFLLGGMAAFWLVDGLVSPFVIDASRFPSPLMIDASRADGLVVRAVRFLGRCELAAAVAALISLVAWRRAALFVLYILLFVQLLALCVITGCASTDDPLAWFHPFGPLTKNVAVVVATVVVAHHCAQRLNIMSRPLLR
jgi:hypothetical protein